MDRLTSQDGRITAFRAGAGADPVVPHLLLTDYAAFMQVLPACGHCPPLEVPAAFLAVVSKALA